MKGGRIPGPAGDDDVFPFEENNESNAFHSTSRLNSSPSACNDASKLRFNDNRGSVEGSEFEVLQISEGLLGEMLLTVKNGTLVTQISATSRAKAMFASVLPGDTLWLDKEQKDKILMQINVIASHHSKPLSLVCVDYNGNAQNKIDIASPGSQGAFADPKKSQDASDPKRCRESESRGNERDRKDSSSQAGEEKDEVDELLEGVSF